MSKCTKCNGTGWFAYDHNHSTVCDRCCEHKRGWWELQEGFHSGWEKGKDNYCCRTGCGTMRRDLKDDVYTSPQLRELSDDEILAIGKDPSNYMMYGPSNIIKFAREVLKKASGGLSDEVMTFALAMQKKLDENSHKPGWQNDSHQALLKRLNQEFIELEVCYMEKRLTDVEGEAADVANFAMMLSDNASRSVDRKAGGEG